MDSTGDVGRFTSISIGIDGLPIISYQEVQDDPDATYLKVVHCANAFCAPYLRQR